MPKNVMVTCSQTVTYEYELEIPEGFDVEEYVYEHKLKFFELVGASPTNLDSYDIIVENIEIV